MKRQIFVILFFFVISFLSAETKASLPEITIDDIYSYFRQGKTYAIEKLNGKDFKIQATIIMIDNSENKVFVGDMYPAFFNQEDFNKLYMREYNDIIFIGTIFTQNEIMEGPIGFKNCKLLEIIENENIIDKLNSFSSFDDFSFDNF